MNKPLASYQGLLEEVHGLRSRLASLKRVQAEIYQVGRESEGARNTATETISVGDDTGAAILDGAGGEAVFFVRDNNASVSTWLTPASFLRPSFGSCSP